ncbi:glycosyltransferase [Microbulbifer sp. CNSA002]|uniref:glycosyltransferase n=1 Tax=unclassified Microbulbifer TaxID=2619833 RepID=UPI0039B4B60E
MNRQFTAIRAHFFLKLNNLKRRISVDGLIPTVKLFARHYGAKIIQKMRLPVATSTPSLPEWTLAQMQEIGKDIDSNLWPHSWRLAEINYHHVPVERRGAGEKYFQIKSKIKADKYDVLIFVPWMKMGGADLATARYIDAYASLGKNVLLVLTEESEVQFINQGTSNFDFVSTKELKCDPALELAVVERLIVQLSPSYIHIINSKVAWELLKLRGHLVSKYTNVVVSLFCNDYLDEGLPVGYAEQYLADCSQYIYRIVSDNSISGKVWQDRIGVREEHVCPIYLPARQLKRKCFSSESKNILWSGRFDRQKNLSTLFKVAADMGEFNFYVYGDFVIDSGSALSYPPNVYLMGTYNDIEEVAVRDYLLFLNTSLWDGLPNIILECLALGLPVISSSVGGIPDILDKKFLVNNPLDSEEYKIVISEFLEDIEESMRIFEESTLPLLESRHNTKAFQKAMHGVLA